VQKYLSGKASGLLTFGLKGPQGEARARGARFLDSLALFTRLVNIGDVRSLATHPASTTHRQLSAAELEKAGVSEDTVRLSIGIEDLNDLVADLDAALEAV
jgi:O-acetylhomoserine (thiol)-lyase